MKRERGLRKALMAIGFFSVAVPAAAQPLPPPPAPPAAAPAPAAPAPAPANPPPATPDGPAPAPTTAPPPATAPGTAPAPTPGGPPPTPDGPAPATAAPVAAPAPAPTPTPPPGPPPPNTGFQMGFRLGLAFPLGDATEAANDTLAARYAWQVPLGIELGAKIGPNVFVGGYFGYAFGAEGSDPLVEAICDDNDGDLENDIDCDASTARFGLELQYHFAPDQKMNPWVGYGAGFEWSDETLTDRSQSYTERTTVRGFTAAKLDGGIDFRSKVMGAGPYIEVAIGQFTSSKTEIGSDETSSGDIPDAAWHAWLTFGIRMVLFP